MLVGRLVTVWTAASALTLAVVAGTKLGPVVMTFGHSGHGVHTGDLATLVVCAMGAVHASATIRLQPA